MLLSWWRCVELVAALLLSLLLSCCSCLVVDTLACMRYAGSACDYPAGLALWMRRGPGADTPPAHPESHRRGRNPFSDKLDHAPDLARFASPRELRTRGTRRVMVFTPAIRGDADTLGVGVRSIPACSRLSVITPTRGESVAYRPKGLTPEPTSRLLAHVDHLDASKPCGWESPTRILRECRRSVPGTRADGVVV